RHRRRPLVHRDRLAGQGGFVGLEPGRLQEAEVRRHQQAWQISQFLHGEQGALVCTAKIVQQVPDIDSKFYAATQVVDEARHVEAYAKLLNEKFELAYPITPPLKALLDDVIKDKRWDFTYLGMQVMIEGLALAAFHGIRSMSANPLAAQVNAYVMQDEARHVAFGRLALKDYYPQLTEAERAEREEFVVEASYHMRDRFTPYEVWDHCGLPVDQLIDAEEHSQAKQNFRQRLFSRIVPTVKQIGLWGPKVQDAYDKMGLLDFAALDADAMFEEDAQVADMFDKGLAPQQQGKGNMAAAE
ncbi:MAG: ferritin-like domain-containing protein, partial [Alphaproteobacteria bacterium]|nr:ferritin-like domain-containing protein [Alphaproteobacteria bacterium]